PVGKNRNSVNMNGIKYILAWFAPRCRSPESTPDIALAHTHTYARINFRKAGYFCNCRQVIFFLFPTVSGLRDEDDPRPPCSDLKISLTLFLSSYNLLHNHTRERE